MKNDEELALKLLETLRKFKKAGIYPSCQSDLSPGLIGMLHIIYHRGHDLDKGISVRQISEICKQTSSGVTQAINLLENKELVTRTVDSDDRRIIRVKLTPIGLKLVEEHHHNLVKLSNDFIENLGHDKITTFIEILDEIIAYGERMNKKDE